MFKKVISIALSLLMASSVVCAAEASESAEREIVNFWYLWTGEEGNSIEKIISAYNESQDKYEVVGLSTPDLQKVLAGVASGNGPDITDDFHSNVPKYAEENISIALDEFIAEDGIDLSGFVQGAVETNQYQGSTYGLPICAMSFNLYYNKDLLAEAGYSEPPATMEELFEMGKALTKVENGEIVQCGFPLSNNITNFVYSAGYDFGTAEELNLANDGVKKILEIVGGLVEEYGDALNNYVTSEKAMANTEQDYFATEKSVFAIDGGYRATMATAAGVNYGVTLIPSFADQGDKYYSDFNTSNFYIPSTSKNKEGAWDFMKFITMGEGAKMFSMLTGNFPAYESLYSDPDIQAHFNGDLFRSLQECELKFFPLMVDAPEYTTAFQIAWDSVLLGEPVEDILADLQKLE